MFKYLLMSFLCLFSLSLSYADEYDPCFYAQQTSFYIYKILSRDGDYRYEAKNELRKLDDYITECKRLLDEQKDINSKLKDELHYKKMFEYTR